MCLALIAFAAHPALPCDRRRQPRRVSTRVRRRPAHGGQKGFLAGRDLKAGGTWLGVDRARPRRASHQRARAFAPRSCARRRAARLVPSVLAADAPPSVSLPALVRAAAASQRLQPDRRRCPRASVGLEPRGLARSALGPGIYGVSNHLLDTPWPKVVAHEGTRFASGARRCRADDPAALLRALARYRARARRRCCRRPASRSSGSGCFRRPSSSARITARAARPSSPIDHDGQCAASSSAAFDPAGDATGEVDVPLRDEAPSSTREPGRRGP